MSNQFDIKDRIKSVHLSKTEAAVARYLVSHESNLCFTTAKEIALELNISDTSVIRTCRKLGYKGYTDLQEQQQHLISSYMENGRYVLPMNQMADKYEKYKGSSNSVCLDFAINNLNSVFLKNDESKFRSAADLIYKSNHIYITGFRGMAAMAESLSILLHQYVPFVDLSNTSDTSCIEKAVDLTPDDCMILFSVERYSKMSCILAEIARENGCKLIVIVDKITAPVAYKSDLVLLSEFSSPLAINSFIATQFIVESIIFEVSKINGLIQQNRLRDINKNLEKLDLY